MQPGVYVHDDYDFERPSVELKTQKVLPRTYTPSDYEVYDYPGYYLQKADGEQYALGADRRVRQPVRARQRGDQRPRRRRRPAAHARRVPARRSELRAPGRGREPRSGVQRLRRHVRGRRGELPLQLRRDVDQAAVPPEADHAEAVRPGAADRGGRRSGRRRDLHRQVRPREGAVPLGPARQEGREQLVLDPRVASLGGEGLGLGRHAANRPGSDRRFPRGRSRSADHHRARLQRGEPAAVRLPGGGGAERLKSQTHKGAGYNEMSMDDTAGKERVFVHGQYNMDTVVEHDQTSTIHNYRTDRVDVDDSEIDRQQPEVGRRRQPRRDDRVERDADGRRQPDEERRRRTRRSPSAATGARP